MCANRDWFDTYLRKDRGGVFMENVVVCKVIGINMVRVKMYDRIRLTFGSM